MLEKNEYDRNVNTFSNQGRLYQVEYAMKAVEQGCTTLGIQLKDGIILAFCYIDLSFEEKNKNKHINVRKK